MEPIALINNDFLDGTETMSPAPLVNILNNSNDYLLNNACVGNAQFPDATPGTSDKINYSICKAPANYLINSEGSSMSKDRIDLCNQII